MRRGALLVLVVGGILSAAGPAVADATATHELVIREHRFEPSEIDVPAGRRAVIHLRNLDPTAEEFDSSALRVEKVVGGHGEGTVRLQPLSPGSYKFMGEYHPGTAQGVVVAK